MSCRARWASRNGARPRGCLALRCSTYAGDRMCVQMSILTVCAPLSVLTPASSCGGRDWDPAQRVVEADHLGESEGQDRDGALAFFGACSAEPPSERPKFAVPSVRDNAQESRTAAWCAVVSTHTFVSMPPRMIVSGPRERRINSRSVAWKLPHCA